MVWQVEDTLQDPVSRQVVGRQDSLKAKMEKDKLALDLVSFTFFWLNCFHLC